MKIHESSRYLCFGASLPLVALLTFSSFSQQGFDDTLPDFLQPYDADLDGVLTEEELQVARRHRQERREQAHHQWDTNKDGELQQQEIEEAQQMILQEILAGRIDHFESVDVSADRKLSYEEFVQIPGVSDQPQEEIQATFDFIDKSGDDLITEEEFIEAFIPPEVTGLKGAVDANELSQELRKSLTADFERMDQDSDEQLSLEEFLAGNPNQQDIPELAELLTNDFKYRDADENGSLSLDEYLALVLPEGPLDAFLSQDRNRDGFIERGEIAVIFLGAPAEMIDDFLSFHDTDGDGRISREEFEDRRANNNFDSFDLDQDGYLSRAEFQEATIGVEEAVEKAFITMDTDKDDRISKEEFENPGQNVQDEEFNARDTNGDGVISREEIVALLGADDQIVDDIMLINDADGDGLIQREEWVGGF